MKQKIILVLFLCSFVFFGCTASKMEIHPKEFYVEKCRFGEKGKYVLFIGDEFEEQVRNDGNHIITLYAPDYYMKNNVIVEVKWIKHPKKISHFVFVGPLGTENIHQAFLEFLKENTPIKFHKDGTYSGVY